MLDVVMIANESFIFLTNIAASVFISPDGVGTNTMYYQYQSREICQDQHSRKMHNFYHICRRKMSVKLFLLRGILDSWCTFEFLT